MRFISRFINRKDVSAEKLKELEKKLSQLEKTFQEIQESKVPEKPITSEKPEKDTPATIHIEHLQVDKIIVEKLDYANNFGQLGIKDLSGKLNIGTNYEGDFAKKMVEEKLSKNPKINIRTQKE